MGALVNHRITTFIAWIIATRYHFKYLLTVSNICRIMKKGIPILIWNTLFDEMIFF